tara:strand:+ start:116 stop:952 length:837 start_codon:yes stop_codon:yes gene_type:complete
MNRGWLLYLALGVLSACGGNSRAPVEDRHAYPTAGSGVQSVSSTSEYRVQRGDTLYSIAFRYGLDYRKVAAANNIPAPYRIYPGQRIALRETSVAPPPTPRQSVPPAGIPSSRPVPGPAPAPPGPAPEPVPSPPVAMPAPRPPVAVPAPAPVFTGERVSSWRWPTRGRLTRGFSGSVHKGIDLDGERGDPIYAVAAGKVVYAGTGIVGFGELLIIKHNDVYLSAYGHNDRLLVKEGDLVAVGQQIAEKGSSGTDTVKLHFEIRKEGKPIDPQRLLPPR